MKTGLKGVHRFKQCKSKLLSNSSNCESPNHQCCRNELSAQLAQLTQELNTLKSSFQSMQDFAQLPLVFIWQQQLKSVMQQALNHELSSLPESVQVESRKGVSPNLACLSSRLDAQPVNVHAAMRDESHAPRDDSHAPRDDSHAPRDDSHAPRHSTAADAAATEAELGNLTQPSSLEVPNAHASQGLQTLPQQATPAQSSGHTTADSLPQQASTARLPQQGISARSSRQTLSANMHSTGIPPGRTQQKMMHGGLPKHAVPAQPTFLRVCLAELLRLTNPTQSQFQPLLCGWYTAGEQTRTSWSNLSCDICHTLPTVLKLSSATYLVASDCHVLTSFANPKISLVSHLPVTASNAVPR